MISYMISVSCNLCLLLITVRMLGDFLSRQEVNKRWLVCGSVFFYVATLTVSYFISFPIVNFCINLLCIFIISMAYQGELKKKLLVSFVITVINAASDIIAYILIPAAGTGGINLSFIGTVLIALICERIVWRIFENRGSATPLMVRHGIVLTTIPVCSLGVLYSSARFNYGGYYTVLIAFCILAINVIVFFMYYIMEENHLQQVQNIMLKERAKAYSNELNLLRVTQDKVRSLQHDMRHHLIEIEGMVNKQEWNNIKAYLESMRAAMKNPQEYVYSGNVEVDSLLNVLLQKAHERLKTVEERIVLPEEMKIDTFQFNVIIGNLLENAIRASEESEDQFLAIDMEVSKGVLFLTVKNTFKEIIQSNDRFITTKKDGENHGIGLKNVRNMIVESKGDMRVSIEGNLFITSVMLYI